MSSINQCFLCGNVGGNPEIKTVEGDIKVARFSLATSTGGYKKADGTEVPEVTDWHTIICWRGLASLAEKAVSKGSRVAVMGQIRYREYEKDGQKRYVTDIIASQLIPYGKSEREQPPLPSASDAPQPVQTAQEDTNSGLPF